MPRRIGIGAMVMALVGLSGISIACASQQYISTVTQIEAPNYNQDCLWFQLSGVTQADPQLPNSPWFAIPRTQNGYNEIYAMLLAAKLSGTSVQVATTGAPAGGACNQYSGVAWIVMI
jgi:hypothetical protein